MICPQKPVEEEVLIDPYMFGSLPDQPTSLGLQMSQI